MKNFLALFALIVPVVLLFAPDIILTYQQWRDHRREKKRRWANVLVTPCDSASALEVRRNA